MSPISLQVEQEKRYIKRSSAHQSPPFTFSFTYSIVLLSNRLILSVYNIDLLVHIINISYHHEI